MRITPTHGVIHTKEGPVQPGQCVDLADGADLVKRGVAKPWTPTAAPVPEADPLAGAKKDLAALEDRAEKARLEALAQEARGSKAKAYADAEEARGATAKTAADAEEARAATAKAAADAEEARLAELKVKSEGDATNAAPGKGSKK